jgi:hypothetical protein
MLARRPTTGRKAQSAPPAFGAYSISSFCQAHALSEAMYFKLRSQGLAPAEMAVSRRRLISTEAAARWRRQREVARKCSKQEESTEIA